MQYSLDKQELRASLKWLVKLRWAGILIVLVATHLAKEIAALSFSLIPVYGVLGYASLYNLYFKARLAYPSENPRKLAIQMILLDQISLALAVYFSGGIDSPFLYLFIFHIVISGIILPWRWTFAFAGLSILFPTAVIGLTYFGVIPHYGIFKGQLDVLRGFTALTLYGLAFAFTIFLTAYFVTYLSIRLYKKSEEMRRLYTLSERLRSSIRFKEVISIVEEELCDFMGVKNRVFMPLNKIRRILTYKDSTGELHVPLIDKNSFTDAIMKGSGMIIEGKSLTSGFEATVLERMGSDRCMVLPVMASSLSPCFEYFQCQDKSCEAYGNKEMKCWLISGTNCRGRKMRNFLEKLDSCMTCELFTPVGLYVLDIPREYIPLEKVDETACERLLQAAGLAISNALLYERTLELSKMDGLTGLKNHREFKTALQTEVLRSTKYQRPLALLMIDVDDFKHYNDLHGHPQGDVLLKRLSDLVKDNFQATDIVARYGGEEFAVLMLETTKKQAIDIAEKLRHMIEWLKFPKEETQPGKKLTVSIGVSGCPEDGGSPEEVLQAADDALMSAKMSGKNKVVAAGEPLSLD